MKYYEVSQAADILQLSHRRVQELCQAGVLRTADRRIGRAWLIEEPSLKAYAEEKRGIKMKNRENAVAGLFAMGGFPVEETTQRRPGDPKKVMDDAVDRLQAVGDELQGSSLKDMKPIDWSQALPQSLRKAADPVDPEQMTASQIRTFLQAVPVAFLTEELSRRVEETAKEQIRKDNEWKFQAFPWLKGWEQE